MIPNINYNEKGQRSDIHYGNGCKTRYEYDKNTFRLIRLLATRNTGRDILQDIHYTYDPVGNIVEIVDNAQQNHYFSNSVIEPRAMYKYDALYRLIEATGREKSGLANAFSNADMGIDFPIPHNGANSMENYTHFYAYDKLGNIMSMNSQGKWLRNYVYAPGSNLLLKHDSQQTIDDYAYDEHGNITRMPGIEDMQWNYADYLSKTQCGTVNTWYVYDQSGNRSRKITEKQGGIREERIYLGSYELYRKYQGAELVIERSIVHIMDDKTRVAIVDRQTVENGNTVSGTVNYRYQLSNHLGSATLELDQTAQIISYEEYHPFGTTSYWSGQSESEVKKKRYRYVGKERDEETGLYYYGARYYAAWIGRFVSIDPLAEKYLNLSPYVYVADNPIKYIDPDGKNPVVVIAKNESGGGTIDVSSKIFIDPKKLPKGVSLEQAQAFAKNMNEKLSSDLSTKGLFIDKNNNEWEISVCVTYIVETPSVKDFAFENSLVLNTSKTFYGDQKVFISTNIFKEIAKNKFTGYSTAREESVHSLGFGDRYEVVGKPGISGSLEFFGIFPMKGWEQDILTGSVVRGDAIFDPKHFDDIGSYFEERNILELIKVNDPYIRESFNDQFDSYKKRSYPEKMLNYNEINEDEKGSITPRFSF